VFKTIFRLNPEYQINLWTNSTYTRFQQVEAVICSLFYITAIDLKIFINYKNKNKNININLTPLTKTYNIL
jgi:hypothetical protein